MMDFAQRIGRTIRVFSISFPDGFTPDEIRQSIRENAVPGTDLVILPETWPDIQHHIPERIDGPAVSMMSELATELETYVVCPIDRTQDGIHLNTSVLIDRQGCVAGFYDKVYPYWSEFDLDQPVTPGQNVPVFETDFGKLGLAICFDVNFPQVWQDLADGGAEIVAWSSAYSAGSSLQAHALNHHYWIVTSTLVSDCSVIDIAGREILYESSGGIHTANVEIDLDWDIYHQNFNTDGRTKALNEWHGKIGEEIWLEREQWFILKALVPGVSARSVASDLGLEELRSYKKRSRLEIDAIRESGE